LPAFVTKLEWSGTTEPAEINFIDPDTGIVVYTTPMLPNIPKARERAINWARRHGFHYDITDRGHFTRRSA
jgi:hypothetical protein